MHVYFIFTTDGNSYKCWKVWGNSELTLLYFYMDQFFFKFFSQLGCYIILRKVLVLYSRPLLFILFKYSSMYMSIPNSQSILYPLPSHLHKFGLSVCESVSVLFICIIFFKILYISEYIYSIYNLIIYILISIYIIL